MGRVLIPSVSHILCQVKSWLKRKSNGYRTNNVTILAQLEKLWISFSVCFVTLCDLYNWCLASYVTDILYGCYTFIVCFIFLYLYMYQFSFSNAWSWQALVISAPTKELNNSPSNLSNFLVLKDFACNFAFCLK